jgi:hypothetical protein
MTVVAGTMAAGTPAALTALTVLGGGSLRGHGAHTSAAPPVPATTAAAGTAAPTVCMIMHRYAYTFSCV